jgi:hypothetical protein
MKKIYFQIYVSPGIKKYYTVGMQTVYAWPVYKRLVGDLVGVHRTKEMLYEFFEKTFNSLVEDFYQKR